MYGIETLGEKLKKILKVPHISVTFRKTYYPDIQTKIRELNILDKIEQGLKGQIAKLAAEIEAESQEERRRLHAQ